MVKINHLVTFHHYIINPNTIVFYKNEEIRNKLCQLPYPGHKKGCPNYGKSENCPPDIPIRTDIFKLYSQFILVVAKFHFQIYCMEMKSVHSDWSERRIKNVLYWQGQLKKLMRNYIQKLSIQFGKPDELFGAGSGFWNYPSMEAVGINVFATLKRNNISFEIRPETIVTMVALLLYKNKTKYSMKLI